MTSGNIYDDKGNHHGVVTFKMIMAIMMEMAVIAMITITTPTTASITVSLSVPNHLENRFMLVI